MGKPLKMEEFDVALQQSPEMNSYTSLFGKWIWMAIGILFMNFNI